MARSPSLARRTCPLVVALGLGLGLTACRSPGAETRPDIPQAPIATPTRTAEADRLASALRALGPAVSDVEASSVAQAACEGAADLAREYRVVHPAWLHNTLINVGLKRRGLCYHWAEDLQARLGALERRELVLRWVVARQGTWREHNAVLVHARDREPGSGLVLDAWRHGGRLHWAAFRADKYPWRVAD